MPTKTTDAIDAANAIVSIMKVHGTCRVTSDRGPAFASKLMNTIAKVKGIKWRHDSSHMPSSNGLVEQKVSTVKNLIKTSSYFAFHGRHPIDVFEHNLQLDPLPSSGHVFIENLMKESELRHSLIKEAKNISSKNMILRSYHYQILNLVICA